MKRRSQTIQHRNASGRFAARHMASNGSRPPSDPYQPKDAETIRKRRKRSRAVALMATAYALDAATILLFVLTVILIVHAITG